MVFELYDEAGLAKFLSKVDELLKDYLTEKNFYPSTSEPRDLYEYARKRVLGPGKKFRPALALATCKVFSEGEMQKALPWAAAIETDHAGLLDIDDYIDSSKLRRGEEATWIKIGYEKALVVGLMNCAAIPWACIYDGIVNFGWTQETSNYLLQLFYTMQKETAEGEFLDIMYRKSRDLTKEKQKLIYLRKTGAYTLAAPAAGGAKIGGADKKTADDLYAALKINIGPGFQMRDDIRNVTERDLTKYGKEFGDDLNEGKPTYLVALFNEEASEEDKDKFYKLFGRLNPPLSMEERNELVALLEKYDVINKTKEESEEMLRYGMEIIKSILPQNENSKEFWSLLQYAIKW